jgi:hypothetical protein
MHAGTGHRWHRIRRLLVRRLLGRGHKIVSLDKSPGLFDDELRSSGATLITGSVTNADEVNRAMNGPGTNWATSQEYR